MKGQGGDANRMDKTFKRSGKSAPNSHPSSATTAISNRNHPLVVVVTYPDFIRPAGASDGTHPPGRADQLSDLEPQWILPPRRRSELGWNRWMCGYRIHLEHPIRIDGLETTTTFGPTKSIACFWWVCGLSLLGLVSSDLQRLILLQ